jgi:uncharacterized protein
MAYVGGALFCVSLFSVRVYDAVMKQFPGTKKASEAGVKRIVDTLGVLAHPEGGYFIETYRSGSIPMASKGLTATDGVTMSTDREGADRNHMTSMIFMATDDAQGSTLYFGKNLSDHVHYYHGGGSYTYITIDPTTGAVKEEVLGPNVAKGEKLQIVFPHGVYKAGYLNKSSSLAENYCLIGEAVAPGFDFRDFQFVTEVEVEAALKSSSDFEKYVQWVKPDKRRNFDDYYKRE